MMRRKIKMSCMVAGIMGIVLLSGCGDRSGASGAVKTEVETSISQDLDTPQEDTNAEAANGEHDSNVLIAYFAVAENSDVDAVSSASMVLVDGEAKGRMQYLAELIQSETGGELFSIQTAVDYPGDGRKLVDYAAEEQDENARPELTSQIENLDQYDTVFVGFPTWWYDLPQAMYSFFDEYDFSDKTIIPFNSHNGSRFSGTIETIAELEPDAKVITDGFTISEKKVAGAGEDVASWLRELGF